MRVSRRTRVVLVLAVAVASVGGESVANAGSVARSARQVSVARDTLVRGLDASQRVLVPPRATYLRALPRSAGSQMLLHGRQTLGQYFVGKQLADQEYSLANGVATLQNDATFRVLGGGADHLVVTRSDVGGANVRLVGTVRIWQKMAQVQKHGNLVLTTPSSIVDFKASVAVSDAVARVSSFSWTFHPGSEP